MSHFINRIGFAHIGRVGSVFVTISVSFERYLSVRYPNNNFKIKKWLIPLPIAFSILYNLPKFFEFVTCDVNSNPHTYPSIHSFSVKTSYSNLSDHIKILEVNRTDNRFFGGYENGSIYDKNDTSSRFYSDIQNLVKKAYLQRDLMLNHNKTDFRKIEDDNLEVDCTRGEYGVTLLRKNRWYIIFYVFWSDFIIIEMLPWIIIVVLNLLTWKGIRQFQKNRKRFMRTHSPGNVK